MPRRQQSIQAGSRVQPASPRGPDRRIARLGLVAAIFGIVAAAPALAAPPELPALVEPATSDHHAGKVIFTELVTPDLVAAKRFYGELFGWSFRDIDLGRIEFTEASLEGRPVAGMIRKDMPADGHRQPAWLTFIATRDVDAAEALAVQHGAKLLFKPHTIPRLGREAVLADPQGAVFAMLASSSGDPPDALADPGNWIWSSLITNDPDTDAAFYQTLFGYDVFDLPGQDETRHLMLASDSYARASVNPLPSERPDARPRWLNYIRVDDVAATSAKVVSLGGSVVVPPRIDRNGGRIAVVVDPAGAAFGLLEWSNDRNAGAAK